MAGTARRVLIVGAGITGLTAAHRLVALSRDGAGPDTEVTVLEASDRSGGNLWTGPLEDPVLDGLGVDVGADAFLRRVPWALELCDELGLGDELTSPTARRASLWLDGALRSIPGPNVLGVPLDPDTLEDGLLGPDPGGATLARLAGDGRPGTELPEGDLAVGAVVRACVGDAVFERLVDPLLGGVNAGRADDLSCVVMAPQLLAAARSHDGLLATLRRAAAGADPTAPVFAAPASGMGRLAEALVDHLTGAGVAVATGSTVTLLERDGDGWLVHVAGGPSDDGTIVHRADAVVLAVPANVAADLVAPHAPDAGRSLAGWKHASVVLATFAYDRGDLSVDPDQSGFLVGRAEGLLMTACSFAGSKWAQLDHPDRTLLRVSCGRIDDERPADLGDGDLVAALRADLAATLGVEAPPTAVRVGRFDRSLLQFPVGHVDRLAAVDAALTAEAPGLLLAGAIRHGVGIPACVRSGNEAAERAVGILD